MPELRTTRSRLRVAVALAVTAASAVVRAEEGGARLVVSAVPPVLSPGERRLAVRVEGCPELPVITANVGAIANVRTVAPAVAAADYLPPGEARPQVAIVTATCGARHGWTTVPIVGRGVAIARTDPGAAIRVTIGARSFGPAIADGEGNARVPVEVPPGVRFAYQGERALDLHVPAAPHVHVALDRASGRADHEEVLSLRSYAITEAGAPRAAAPLHLAPSEGVVSDAAEVEPGLVVARWTLPPGRAGRVVLEATLEGDAGPAAVAALERRPGPPARVEASPDRPLAVAGEAPLQLDVRVVDAAGNLTPAPLRVEPSEAVVLDAREVAPGRWAVGLDVPERLEGRDALGVSMVAGEAGAAARVPLAAAPPVALAVEPPARGELVADGEAAFDLKVAQVDRFGNPSVDPPPAAATAEPAEVSTVREGDAFRVTVRPRRRLVAGEDAVTIQGAGRTERLPLLLRPVEPWLAVGARLGYLASAGGLRSAYLGAEAALWPDAWRHFGVSLEGGTFAHERTDRVALGGGAIAVAGEVRYLPVAASARWRLAPSPRTVLGAGAGVVLAPLSAEVRVAGQPPARENGLAAGGQLAFGAGRKIGAGVLFLEARGIWLADPGLDVVRGRVLATGLVAGWALGLR